MTRPSHKELSGKIRAATTAVAEKKVGYTDPFTIALDAMELNYDFKQDFCLILNDLLSVVTSNDYKGTSPPQKSYEKVIRGLDLFAFVVRGTILDEVVYFKFSMKKDYCYIVSLHKDRPEE